MKSKIIEQLGHGDILLPSLIAEGLEANDRVKVRLGILQSVERHAHDPIGARFDLGKECRSVGLDVAAMEELVNGAVRLADGAITAPGLDDLGASISVDMEIMVRAVKAGDTAAGEAALARLKAIKDAIALDHLASLEPGQIAKLTTISNHAGDSLHRLIMDLHKALNALAASHAKDELAGAHVFGLLPQDNVPVEAFMRGLNSTRQLKFNHPGLDTTAARSGARLSIQNDIGETEAHVVVIIIEPEGITVTHTDVHFARAKFFTGMLRNFPVQWSGLESKSTGNFADSAFYLVNGHCKTADSSARDAFLEALGASLVFLIDWNKARKILRAWISNADAVCVLEWAARNRVGHRAFLELGGSELIAAAVRNVAPTRIGFGDRLDNELGREPAVDFLKAVLRISAESMLNGASQRVARDRIEAELVRHLQGIEGMLMATVLRQAGLAHEIAGHIAEFVAAKQMGRSVDQASLSARARRIEEKADKIAVAARKEIRRLNADPDIEQLVDAVEETIDELEQAAFVVSLVPLDLKRDVLAPLADLSSAALAAAEAAASGVAAAIDVPAGHRVDSEDALAAITRLIDAEHKADDAERALTAIVLCGNFDLQTALSTLELARALERATDFMMRFGHVLHQHVLADLTA